MFRVRSFHQDLGIIREFFTIAGNDSAACSYDRLFLREPPIRTLSGSFFMHHLWEWIAGLAADQPLEVGFEIFLIIRTNLFFLFFMRVATSACEMIPIIL